MSSTQTVRGAVAQRQQQTSAPTIASFITTLQPEIARALPKHLDADRIARLALTVVRQTPGLARCKPESFAGALLTAAALGLEPGVSGEAYLVPYGQECQFIPGYQGLTKLFYQHPAARHIDAQAVHERDHFDYAYGLDPFLTHKPALGDRGQVIAYYAVASLNSGAKAFVVLSPEEVKALRGGKVGPSGKIADPMRWMERKTALRQLLKTLPKSTNLNLALAADEVNGSTLRNRQLAEAGIAGAIEAPDSPQQDAPAGVDPETGEAGPEWVEAEVMDPPEDMTGWSA